MRVCSFKEFDSLDLFSKSFFVSQCFRVRGGRFIRGSDARYVPGVVRDYEALKRGCLSGK